MSQPPKTDLARELWETCPECYGWLVPELGGDLVCPEGHYRAEGAATVEWREDTAAKPLVADGGGCPECGSPAARSEGGCLVCPDCGYWPCQGGVR